MVETANKHDFYTYSDQTRTVIHTKFDQINDAPFSSNVSYVNIPYIQISTILLHKLELYFYKDTLFKIEMRGEALLGYQKQ